MNQQDGASNRKARFAKSSSLPYPTSTTLASILPLAPLVTIPSPSAAREISPGPAIRASYLLRPTSPEACTSQCERPLLRRETRRPPLHGFGTSGDPVTRPPISSVSRRKFSSIGDAPITIGRIFAAAQRTKRPRLRSNRLHPGRLVPASVDLASPQLRVQRQR